MRTGEYQLLTRINRRSQEISRACERIGFFMVSGHGVDPALIERARRESVAFFDLPFEEKLAIRRPEGDLAVRGYEPVGTEHLSATIGVETPPDLKESISFGPVETFDHPSCHTEQAAPCYAPNIWPQQPSGLRRTIEDYIRALDLLGWHLHRLAAIAFDLPEDHFDAMLERGFSILRVLNYPEQKSAPKEGQLRAGEHSDYDNLTICLIEDKPGGLQARGPNGTWVNVPAIPGSFVVNIGDFLMRWTNDRWKSTRHRVLNPPHASRGPALLLPLHRAQLRRADRVPADLPQPRAAGEVPADHRRRLHAREILRPGERRRVERRAQREVRHRRHRDALRPITVRKPAG